MPPDTDDSDDLLARAQQGDQAALAELFTRHREKLRRMVIFRLDERLAGRVSASDVLQEAYIDALRRIHHYFDKPQQSFLGWLRLIVRQRLVEVHRQHLAEKRDVSREHPLDHPLQAGEDSFAIAAAIAGQLSSPSQAVRRHEHQRLIQQALEQMDPLDREVLALRHFEELSNSETAAVLGIEPPAASKRYVRALARLKQIIESLPGFAPSAESQPKGQPS